MDVQLDFLFRIFFKIDLSVSPTKLKPNQMFYTEVIDDGRQKNILFIRVGGSIFFPPTPVNEHIPTPLTFFQNASKQPLLTPSFFVGPFETEFLLFAFWLGRVSKTREKW